MQCLPTYEYRVQLLRYGSKIQIGLALKFVSLVLLHLYVFLRVLVYKILSFAGTRYGHPSKMVGSLTRLSC